MAPNQPSKPGQRDEKSGQQGHKDMGQKPGQSQHDKKPAHSGQGEQKR